MSQMPHPVGDFEPQGEADEAFASALASQIGSIDAVAERREDGTVIIRAELHGVKIKLKVPLDEAGFTDWGNVSNLLTMFPNIVLQAGTMLEDATGVVDNG